MNKRLLTILLLAFVIAGACAFLVYKAVGNRLGGGTPSSTRVVAAAADLKIGALLTAQNLTTLDIAGAVPKGAILDPKNAIGRGVVEDIYQGEPILDSRLAPVGSGGGLAATIPAGMRAMAVKVDDVVGVAGFATPGMHVDVLCSVPSRLIENQPSQQENTVVKTILQNIEVLSAGVSIQKDPEGKAQPVQVVNLLVTPDQAQTLSLASTGANGTKIQLVLRNPLDTETKEVKENSVGTIFSGANVAPVHVAPHRAKAAAAAPTGHISVEVINGSKRTEEKFNTPEEKQ
jgi:pilus assembly protein CpaB